MLILHDFFKIGPLDYIQTYAGEEVGSLIHDLSGTLELLHLQNIKYNTSETLHFEDLAVKNYFF